MKLEVGMYCYNKTNRKLGLGKIISFQSNNNVNIKYKNDIELVSIGNVIASFNIIDLIEVGEAFKFKELRTHISNKSNTKYYENYIFDVHNEEELEVIKREIKQGKIKLLEILTKEQFEQMSYKVGE